MKTQSGMSFIRAELDTGLTLSRIALDAADNQPKRERNRVNARKAYNAILHFMPDAVMTDADLDEVREALKKLRSNLHELGEDLPAVTF